MKYLLTCLTDLFPTAYDSIANIVFPSSYIVRKNNIVTIIHPVLTEGQNVATPQ